MSLVIDADGEFVSLTGASPPLSGNGVTAATLILWLKRASGTNDWDFSAMVASNLTYGSAASAMLMGHRNGTIDHRVRTNNEEAREVDTLAGSNLTVWQLSVLVYNGPGVPFTMYAAPVGGSIASRTSSTNPTNVLNAMTELMIANQATPTGARIRATHICYVPGIAATLSQVQQLFNGGNAGNGANPRAVFPGAVTYYRDLISGVTGAGDVGPALAVVGGATFDAADNPPVDPPPAASVFSAGATLARTTAAGTLSAIASAFAAGATLARTNAGGTLSLMPGTITVPELRNWSGALLTNTTVENVVVIRISDRALLAAFTDRVSDPVTADLSMSQAGLVQGTQCLVVGFNADGSAAFTRAVTIV